jgi:hypothetical protein
MTEPRRPLAWALAILLAAGAVAAEELSSTELLAASDLFARAPEAFRAELEIRPLGATSGHRLEIYRKGRDRELVRFLAEKERGKFLLRRDEQLYFLSPGTAQPVKLAPSHRVHGADIHDLLGLDLARDYRTEKVSEENGVVTFDLVAQTPAAAAARLRWVVSRATRRPLRADLQTPQRRVLHVIEFKRWRDAAQGVPESLVVKDLVNGSPGPPLEIRFLEFEPKAVDDALFDLESGTARAALP